MVACMFIDGALVVGHDVWDGGRANWCGGKPSVLMVVGGVVLLVVGNLWSGWAERHRPEASRPLLVPPPPPPLDGPPPPPAP